MGTFILTFIGRSLSMWFEEVQLAKAVPKQDVRRKLMVIAYFVTIALIIGVFGVLTIPYIVREGADFISRLQAENIWYGGPQHTHACMHKHVHCLRLRNVPAQCSTRHHVDQVMTAPLCTAEVRT